LQQQTGQSQLLTCSMSSCNNGTECMCPICFDNLDNDNLDNDIYTCNKCKICIHNTCKNTWLSAPNSNKLCPLCRTPIQLPQLQKYLKYKYKYLKLLKKLFLL
jgi:hypothetical protein